MDYKGWVLSIYDEYVKRYNEKYNAKEEKVKLKDVISIMKRKEKRAGSIAIILFLLSIILLMGLSLFGKIENAEIYIMAEVLCAFLIAYFYNYKHEVDIQTYHRRVDVLREVLIDEGLYNEGFVRSLRSYTGGIFYKISEKIRGVIKGGIGIASIIGFNYTFIRSNNDIVLLIVAIMAIVMTIAYYAHIYLICMPNSRVIRRGNFHVILNILIAYDFESKSTNKNISDKSTFSELAKVKDIIEKINETIVEKN
ncbi:hypothetical protein [Clostridium sp. UBA4548]|uniref:hypothetical protein n=1 Tax=Clostridium sp. UBA4548 TaxID=1946361 RepID=UPI0025C732A6|nr:hypothetical protein [Clostridium sp. UBA4548]